MISIAIVDDEPKAVEEHNRIVKTSMQQAGIGCETISYTDGRNLVADIVDDGVHFDVIIVDIEMPGVTGMEISATIRPFLPDAKIIIVTSHMEYVLDAFELAVFRYVPKTELSQRLANAVVEASRLTELQSGDTFVIQSCGRLEKMRHGDILYIQRGRGKNSVIHTTRGLTNVRKSIKQIYDELASPVFIYVDRGTVVNIVHVAKVIQNNIFLNNGESLPISMARAQDIRAQICRFWGNEL